MKLVRKTGLLAVAAAGMMAFAATASGDEVTNGTGSTVTSIHATSEGHPILDAPYGKIECSSTLAGNITDQGAGKVVKGTITTLDFTNCTGTKTVFVFKTGTFTLDVTGTNVGTLTSSGAEITVFDHTTGIDCIYTTSNTHIGTVTVSKANEPGAGTIDIKSIIPRTGGSFFCGSSGEWTGSYFINSPNPLHLDAS